MKFICPTRDACTFGTGDRQFLLDVRMEQGRPADHVDLATVLILIWRS